jgi:hypothetical protein
VDHFFEDVDVPTIIKTKTKTVARFVYNAAMKRDEEFFVANLQIDFMTQPQGISVHESSILGAGRLGTAVARMMGEY